MCTLLCWGAAFVLLRGPRAFSPLGGPQRLPASPDPAGRVLLCPAAWSAPALSTPAKRTLIYYSFSKIHELQT